GYAAEFIAARPVIGFAKFVHSHRIRFLGNGGHHFAAFNLVRSGGPLVAIANRVAVVAGSCDVLSDMPGVALAFGSVGDAELVASCVVAYPEGLAHDERLQLRIAQLGCTLCLEV